MNKIVLIILTNIIIPVCVFSQKGSNTINQFNPKHEKEGFWVENIEDFTIEQYYFNGKRTGIHKEYIRKKIHCLGEYRNDSIIGTWCYFWNDGHLMMILTNCEEGQFEIPKTSVIEGEPFPHKGYCVVYYPNGMKQSEGFLLWDNSPLSDFTCEYGEWKYYDENGNLTETKYFY
jgi:antitoxin component YwqK of YwqJK toxin-antitoxin module